MTKKNKKQELYDNDEIGMGIEVVTCPRCGNEIKIPIIGVIKKDEAT